MYLVQLTDLHIGQPGEDTRGIDVRSQFLRVLERVRVLSPDAIILSGDLCYMEGDASIYAWIADQIRPLGVPVYPISGNHDDPKLLAGAFGIPDKITGKELFYEEALAGQPALFLDTTPGFLSDDQYEWLDDRLAAYAGQPLLVFMHHPPCHGGVVHMDTHYPLTDRERFQEALFRHEAPVDIFCGHYHIERSIRLHHLTIHISPSTFFQIDMHEEAFAVDHTRPGFRDIWLERGYLATAVHYEGE